MCLLFGNQNDSDAICSSGYNDWKNVVRTIKRHERTLKHLESDSVFRQRHKQSGTLDISFESNVQKEADYWRNILKRIVEVIKFLGTRGLAFRGQDEIIGSNHNGNFLGILEMLSKFDPILKEHISRYGNQGRGNQSVF